MNKQPEALRLADELEHFWGHYSGPEEPHEMNAAAELRRLHAANTDCIARFEAAKSERDELLEALHRITPIECHMVGHRHGEFHSASEPCPAVARIEAAIAKATGGES